MKCEENDVKRFKKSDLIDKINDCEIIKKKKKEKKKKKNIYIEAIVCINYFDLIF